MRSTEETDKRRAKIKCEAMARIAEEEARGDGNRDLLERIVNDTLYRLGHSPIEKPTVREFFERWLANERNAVAPRSHSRYSQVVRDFLARLGSRADAKLTTIGETDILSYRDWLLSGGRSPQTFNNTIGEILKRAFKIAVESGLIDRNPVALVKMLKGTKDVVSSKRQVYASKDGIIARSDLFVDQNNISIQATAITKGQTPMKGIKKTNIFVSNIRQIFR